MYKEPGRAMSDSNSRMGTVLVIGDYAREVRAYLEPHHYQIHFANRRDKFSALVEAVWPDVIIMDALTRRADSFSVCRRLKHDLTVPFLPILMLVADLEDWSQSLKAGADDALIYPIREDDLLMRVTAMIHMKHHYDSLWLENQTLTQDLAQRNKELERALRESQGATVLKDSIVRNVSHELRTPLLQVKSAVSMIAEDIRRDPRTETKLVDYALQATARLESVVQNITQLAAAQNVRIEAFRMTDAVKLAIRQLERQWASSDAVARITVDRIEETPLVLGDRSGVAQVLQQLLDNALKFSPETSPVDIIVQRTGDYVEIAVQDYGIGIDEKDAEDIFKPFYQIDSSTTRRYGGVGNGLAIVKLIIDALNTTIRVLSKPGKGSIFSFALPIAREDLIEGEVPVKYPAHVG
jgi:signal transduction histidine kinase